MIGIIYKYTSPSNKCYIGQTIHEHTRRSRHKHNANVGEDTKFYQAIRKYGFDNLIYEVLFTIINDDKIRVKEKLDFMERYYIKKFDSYNNGYNMTPGGTGGSTGFSGHKHSEETKMKISNALSGVNNPFYMKENPFKGKHHTEETKQKIKDAWVKRKQPNKN